MLDKSLHAVIFPLAAAYARLLRAFSTPEPFLPTDGLAWVSRLEADWRVIRAEMELLRSGFELPALIEMIPGEQALVDGRWRMLFFRYFGQPVECNCSLCPRTAEFLDGIPGLVSAGFSVLEPGARIAPHRGIFGGLLRYHLGLVVPGSAGACGLRVGNEIRGWREGESLLFDDTHRHEAWNRTDRERVVLLLDVKRQLPMPLRWLNEAALFILSRVIMLPLPRMEAALAKPIEHR